MLHLCPPNFREDSLAHSNWNRVGKGLLGRVAWLNQVAVGHCKVIMQEPTAWISSQQYIQTKVSVMPLKHASPSGFSYFCKQYNLYDQNSNPLNFLSIISPL